jgi:hypothetical protein
MNKKIEVGQLIEVDSEAAFVSMIYPDQKNKKIEVVYLQNGFKYIFVDAYRKDGEWHFISPPPHGGYADVLPRLKPFVEALRVFHHQKKPPATKKAPYLRRARACSLRSRRKLT